MKIDSQYNQYTSFLGNIKENDNQTFLNFKSHKKYNEVLEHVSKEVGNEYKKLIENEFNIKIKDFVEFIYKNDSVGNPTKYEFDGILMSPSNLRYIYHTLLIEQRMKKWFKKKDIKILEIGGGYCGLAFHIKNILKDHVIDYTIVDLPEPGQLQKTYLQALGQNDIQTVSCFDMKSIVSKKFDLVISNYCLSEISYENQEDYFYNIISNCDKKFFIWNYLNLKTGIWKNLKIKKLLFLLGFRPKIEFIGKEYVFEKERPQTGAINNFIYSR